MHIEEHPFFEELTEESVADLKAGARIVRLDPGEIIFEEDSASDLLYLVLEGTVAFSKRIEGEAFHLVGTTGPGEFFGEIGVITGDPRSLRAEAQAPVVLAALDKSQLEDFIIASSGPVALTLRSVISHLHQTTQHFMEEVLQREKMAVVGKMVNSILHDYKNPVAYIRFAADYLSRRHDDKATKDICEKIDEHISRMLGMADEVSLYSRGEYSPSFSTIHLPDLMQRFRDLNFLIFENEAVNITIEADPIEIEAEGGKLIRVLQNLVGNAIDASPDSGEIHISWKDREDEFVDLRIRDNAGGIPEEIRKNFFDPFVTHGKRGGTGLGSAIAKSIVEAHGGTISFESTMGEGTEFKIRLPKRQRQKI